MNQVTILKILVVIFVVSIILTQVISAAQAPALMSVDGNLVNVSAAKVVWEKTYGGVADDRAFYMVTDGDGYLVVGSTKSIVPNATVGWAIRLDHYGNAVWNKTFFEGSGTELRFAINLTDGFLVVGNEFLASGDINGYAAKIDNAGNVIWQTFVGENETIKLFSAIATQDGYALLGASYSNGTANSEALIAKLDLNGNVVWNKTYGTAQDTVARTGVLAPDGDYMVAGYTNPRGPNDYDFLLMKVDVSGNLVWNNTYEGTGSREAHSMAKASDGYVIVGDMQSSVTDIHAWAVKVDLNGTMLWAKTIGGKNADSPAYITPVQGGYLVAGFTFSWGAGNRDFWLFKIDDSGQVLWSCTQGDAGFQEAYSVIEAGQNQYVMAGWTDPRGSLR